MPFPAARHTVPHGGAAGDQRPGAPACPHPQVGGLLRGGQPRIRQVRSRPVRQVRRRHLREVPQKAVAAQDARQAHGDRPGQCPVPPRRVVGAVAVSISKGSHVVVPAALQPTACAHRARLETRTPLGNTQPVFRHFGRFAQGSRRVLRPLAETQFGAAQTMRHYLGRYV